MKSLKIVAVIPARMGSTRFPGKPLVKILGLEMIEHVRRRVERMHGLAAVWVATCDDEIQKVVEKNGGKVIFTSSKHERATERIEEAAHQFDADVVLNVQGDEPLVSEDAIRDAVSPFYNGDTVDCTCLVYPIKTLEELGDDNIVKTVLSKTGKILYLSRQAIPGRKVSEQTRYYKQSGIMAFKKDFLHKFVKLAPTPLEAKESVDLLRLLEHDYQVQAVVTDIQTVFVDVPAQVKIIENSILSDPEQKKIFESISEDYNTC